MSLERDTSNARLERDVEALRRGMDELKLSLDVKLDNIRSDFNRYAQEMPEKYVPRREINERFSNMSEDQKNAYATVTASLKDLKDAQTWLFRLVAGALVTGIIGVIFNLAKVGIGGG